MLNFKQFLSLRVVVGLIVMVLILTSVWSAVRPTTEGFADKVVATPKGPNGARFFNDAKGDSFCCRGQVDAYKHTCMATGYTDLCAHKSGVRDPRDPSRTLVECASLIEREHNEDQSKFCPKSLPHYGSVGKCCQSGTDIDNKDCIAYDNKDPKRYVSKEEYKCPMSRVLKDEIQIAYVHQMQMQMECTGIDECEYVEFRFKQVNYTEWERSTDKKGCFGVYDDGRVVYNVDGHPEDCQVIYWILTSIKQDFVPKDPNWLSSHIDQLQSLWNEVVTHRAAGTKPDPKVRNVVSIDI